MHAWCVEGLHIMETKISLNTPAPFERLWGSPSLGVNVFAYRELDSLFSIYYVKGDLVTPNDYEHNMAFCIRIGAMVRRGERKYQLLLDTNPTLYDYQYVYDKQARRARMPRDGNVLYAEDGIFNAIFAPELAPEVINKNFPSRKKLIEFLVGMFVVNYKG